MRGKKKNEKKIVRKVERKPFEKSKVGKFEGLSGALTSPSMLNAQYVGVISEKDFARDDVVTNLMQVPICYVTTVVPDFVGLRVVFGCTTSYENLAGGTYIDDQVSSSTMFLRDPTSAQGSEIAETLLRDMKMSN